MGLGGGRWNVAFADVFVQNHNFTYMLLWVGEVMGWLGTVSWGLQWRARRVHGVRFE